MNGLFCRPFEWMETVSSFEELYTIWPRGLGGGVGRTTSAGSSLLSLLFGWSSLAEQLESPSGLIRSSDPIVPSTRFLRRRKSSSRASSPGLYCK